MMTSRQKKLPIAALERIDVACAAFEQQWQAGEPPAIEQALAGDMPADERAVLLAELLALDVDYRRRRGEAPQQDAYRERFPEATAAIDDAFRHDAKQTAGFVPPTVGHLTARFPTLEILELVGAGGMGAVYKARQPGLDRLVALKILPEELTHDPRFALRFTREARTLAKLSHPNIVSVFECGTVEGTYYFLMEFVDGPTLREVIRGGRLPPEQALSIVPHLCDALQYAHDQGVVHRDIKPDNILLARDGGVKIADFGLARILGNDAATTQLTQTHQVMGTPRYMAPEQFSGARGVDHRADIYSLGVVFYEMLTGELPIGRFEVPSHKAAIDVRLDDVVLRSLEAEPQRRYQHASEIKSDVQTITSSDNLALAATEVLGTAAARDARGVTPPAGSPRGMPTPSPGSAPSATPSPPGKAGLAEQELAARLLLSRRELMDRVQRSLRPLFRGQVIQILIGVAIVVLGVRCWALNTGMLHCLICGGILHAYGVLVIASAAAVCTRIGQIDTAAPVAEVRRQLESLRTVYLRVGGIIGFPWWLMWMPVLVALGFHDVVLYRNSLLPSLVVGVLGFVVSYGLFLSVQNPRRPTAEQWRTRLAGKSLANAFAALKEIDQAQIQ